MEGRCLCGQVKYELDGSAPVFGVCHCKNCQRQAGSAFSVLGVAQKNEFTVTQGEAAKYDDSDTDSGNTVSRYFCSNCGSPLYTLVDYRPDLVILKAGTLDDTSIIKPAFHAWCDTKQDWFEPEKGVPQTKKDASSPS